jgi:hypothetical protein
MAGQLVTIATFDLVPKARLAKNILDAAGIKSVVTDENIVTMDWLFGNAVGWVKVQVLEEDAEKAVALLEEALGPTDSVDEEALAVDAESAATGKDSEQSGPPAARGSLPTESTSHDETAVSERDEYARRLYLASVYSVLVPPLVFYAIYLFLNAAFGEGSISEKGRTHLIRGSAIMGAGLLLLFAIFLGTRAMFE